MRPGQQNNKRLRGRNRSSKGPNPLTRSYESNGPDVKIRGTALHIAEKYLQLARDAQSSGDRVAGESYLQHAEHYYRIIAAAQAQMPQPQTFYRNEEGDEDDEGGDERSFGQQPRQNGFQQGYGQGDPQPYVNGNNGNNGYSQPPQPVRADAENVQPQGEEPEGLGQQPDFNGQPGEFQGLPPGEFRNRRRRSNRGRGRRGEGENRSFAGEEGNFGDENRPAPPRDQEVTNED